jgi:hypothetical protein
MKQPIIVQTPPELRCALGDTYEYRELTIDEFDALSLPSGIPMIPGRTYTRSVIAPSPDTN